MRLIFQRPAGRAMALSVALATLMAASATAQPMAEPNSCGTSGPSRLSVVGEGLSRVAPDMATVQVGVTTQADSAAEAMRLNSEQQNAVIEALNGAGIDGRNIQTSGVTLTPLMRYDDGQPPSVTGYQASNLVSVRMADLARVGEVLDTIVTAGANEINGITFSREDDADAIDEALRAAVADARRKAEVLAEASGLSLGAVITMRDLPSGEGDPRPMMQMRSESAGSVPIQPGEGHLSARVEIEYTLTGEAACAG
ncbi:MAG: SIMPL domain-containing protein [Pararhodobacter sp.]